MKKEKILVIKKTEISDIPYGFNRDFVEINDVINTKYQFLPRDIMEDDMDYFQIIPYIVIKNGDLIYTTKRLNKQSEKRLHNKMSIGVGGHINELDKRSHNFVLDCLKRELFEELKPFSYDSIQYLGVINDNSSEVSMVHLGLIYLIETSSMQVFVNETDKMEGTWTNKNDLRTEQIYPYLEDWSKVLVDALAGDIL